MFEIDSSVTRAMQSFGAIASSTLSVDILLMHRCLWISEIVVNIAEEVLQDEEWEIPTSWDTLAKLARTCRMFSEPSLSALWRVQSSLIPLLRTMPDDLWKMDDNKIIMVGSHLCSLSSIL